MFLNIKMPKNKQGGKNFRGKKKSSKNADADSIDRKLETKSDGQEYARVSKLLGNCRLLAVVHDGTEKLCIIPKKFKFRVWIAKDDIILINIRSFQDDKADVIYKYLPKEVKQLTKMGELTNHIIESVDITNNTTIQNDQVYFDDSDSESESDITNDTTNNTTNDTKSVEKERKELDEFNWDEL